MIRVILKPLYIPQPTIKKHNFLIYLLKQLLPVLSLSDMANDTYGLKSLRLKFIHGPLYIGFLATADHYLRAFLCQAFRNAKSYSGNSRHNLSTLFALLQLISLTENEDDVQNIYVYVTDSMYVKYTFHTCKVNIN